MTPIQELNFHLDSGEVIFAHIFSLGDGNFTAQVTQPYALNNLPSTKFYQWLVCPSNSDARIAFSKIAEAIDRKCNLDGNKLVKVNNPCNCEFLPKSVQQALLGSKVSVVMNEPI